MNAMIKSIRASYGKMEYLFENDKKSIAMDRSQYESYEKTTSRFSCAQASTSWTAQFTSFVLIGEITQMFNFISLYPLMHDTLFELSAILSRSKSPK